MLIDGLTAYIINQSIYMSVSVDQTMILQCAYPRAQPISSEPLPLPRWARNCIVLAEKNHLIGNYILYNKNMTRALDQYQHILVVCRRLRSMFPCKFRSHCASCGEKLLWPLMRYSAVYPSTYFCKYPKSEVWAILFCFEIE